MIELKDIKEIGGNPYAICDDCNKLVRLNKVFFGSMHVCLSPEEKAQKEHFRNLMKMQQGRSMKLGSFDLEDFMNSEQYKMTRNNSAE